MLYNKKPENKIVRRDKDVVVFLCESKTHGDKEVIIDATDWDLVRTYRWCVRLNKRFYVWAHDPKGYASGKRNCKVRLHRFLLGLKSAQDMADHINGNTLDNRKSNLRKCSNAENRKNSGKNKNNTSGYKGVSRGHSAGMWRAYISAAGKKYLNLGEFANKDDAARAYNAAALKYHGEFARINEGV